MKNMCNIFWVFCMASILCFTSCQEAPKKDQKKQDVPQKEPVSRPDQIISIQEAQSLFENYAKNRVPLIEAYETKREPEIKFDVARFTSFDYATIKQYMAFIEQEAAKADVEISSLRFYFANYPNKNTFEDGEKITHPRQNSIFIVPTLMENGREFNFYTTGDGQQGRKAVKISNFAIPDLKGVGKLREENKHTYAGFNLNFSLNSPWYQNDESLILNRGNSAPPPHN